ncbi:MAG: GNAT family N-acetyltransferase [Flavobacteriaceae bacterium]|nr:GNAT family N-acetyltransferase [Flavobacteriaceae bacterium]
MSIFNTIKKEDFYIDLTEKNNVLKAYAHLKFSHDQTEFYTDKGLFNLEKVVSIRLFPKYLIPIVHLKNHETIIKVSQDKINGYAIPLNQAQDFETFYKEAFSKSFRANIKRFVSRFETCFNARYSMFFGSISREDYTLLMNALHHMLTNRFNQRNDDNRILNHWSYYMATTYDLINSKKASLFVIYNNHTPVHICINHHVNNILFVSIPSYDIDYAKFALGNISIYKLLEWSFQNNYKLLDMAYGDLEYKRRWSTLIYPFEHHILYNYTWKHSVMAKIEIATIRFKNYLKSKNIDDTVKTIKRKLKRKNIDFSEVNFTSEPVQTTDNTLNKIAVTNENLEPSILKKPLFEFLFKHKVHIDQIHVFEIQASKVYIISVKNISEKITIF